MGEKLRKVLVDIQLHQSKTLEVDGMTVPFRELGTTLLGQSVESFTGMKRMRMTGYHTSPQVTFTITDPLPCTILSIVTEVKFGAGKLQAS